MTAIVLANLCVSYIMTSQNEEAAELMRAIEKEEEKQSLLRPGTSWYHLCIVNIVIGTLYCSKGNFEFGTDRVIKAMEPFAKRLSSDTWFHTKRCFLALAETAAKHMISLSDVFFADILKFLEGCEAHGQTISAVLPGDDQPSAGAPAVDGSSSASSAVAAAATSAAAAASSAAASGKGAAAGSGGPGSAAALSLVGSGATSQLPRSLHTVAYEARLLKRLFIRIRDVA